MKPEAMEANGCTFFVLKPGPTQRIRPLVGVHTAQTYFDDRPQVSALINGTFFDQSYATPVVFGDVKTELGLAWGFPLKQFNKQPVSSPRHYWSPAAGVRPDLDGYVNRWAMASTASLGHLAEFQPSSYSEYRDVDWVMGGGALVLRNGKVLRHGAGGPLGLHSIRGGQFSDAQTYPTTRAWLLLTKTNTVHLAVNAERQDPARLAQALQSLSYHSALMLDGGGATTMGWREGANVKFKFEHPGYRRLHSAVAILAGCCPTPYEA